MTRRLLALAAQLALVALLEPAATAQPLQFELRDADSRVTLYGSIHVLAPASEPLSPLADSALAAAEVVVLEVDTDDPAAVADAFQRYAVYPAGQTLADALSKEQLGKLTAYARQVGLEPVEALFSVRPWAVELMLPAPGPPATLWQPGVDAAVLARARADSLEILTLETVAEQVAAFAGAPEAEQVASLMAAVRLQGRGTIDRSGLVEAWAQGDEAALAAVAAEMPPSVLRDRNAAWVPQIEALLARDGEDAFVVVGVGHLVGPDSVVAMLRARGYAVTRP